VLVWSIYESGQIVPGCPPEAFYANPIHHVNGLVTVLDNHRCLPHFVAFHGCSFCIKVCPYSQQEYGKINAGFLAAGMGRSREFSA